MGLLGRKQRRAKRDKESALYIVGDCFLHSCHHPALSNDLVFPKEVFLEF